MRDNHSCADEILLEREELGSNILRVSQRRLAPRGVLDPTFWEAAGSSPPQGEERESGRAEFLAEWPAPLACSAQVGLFRFFVGVVCLAALSAASLANRRALKRAVLARSALRWAIYSDMACAASVARPCFSAFESRTSRSFGSSVNVGSSFSSPH